MKKIDTHKSLYKKIIEEIKYMDADTHRKYVLMPAIIIVVILCYYLGTKFS